MIGLLLLVDWCRNCLPKSCFRASSSLATATHWIFEGLNLLTRDVMHDNWLPKFCLLGRCLGSRATHLASAALKDLGKWKMAHSQGTAKHFQQISRAAGCVELRGVAGGPGPAGFEKMRQRDFRLILTPTHSDSWCGSVVWVSAAETGPLAAAAAVAKAPPDAKPRRT